MKKKFEKISHTFKSMTISSTFKVRLLVVQQKFRPYVYVFTYIHITSCNTLAQYVRYLLPRQIHTTQIQTNKICAFKHETIHHPLYFVSLMAGSCTSELQLKVNCRLKSELLDKIWAGSANSWQTSPNFFQQFTFSCNSLVHDPPGLSLSV